MPTLNDPTRRRGRGAQWAAVLVAALACAGGGCTRTERWTGRVVAVDMFDHHGDVYSAAALEIESGPEYRPPRTGPAKYVWGWDQTGKVPDEAGGGRVPLLVDDHLRQVIPRDRLPVGRRVAVRGRMHGGPVKNDYSQWGRWGSVIVARVRDPEAEHAVGNEHMIVVDSVKILD